MVSQIKFVSILDVPKELQQRVRDWRNKDVIRKFMLNQEVISLEEHQAWLKGLAKKGNYHWVVFADETPIGMAYLTDVDDSNKQSKWGFYIGADSFRGKGLGKAILKKLLI